MSIMMLRFLQFEFQVPVLWYYINCGRYAFCVLPEDIDILKPNFHGSLKVKRLHICILYNHFTLVVQESGGYYEFLYSSH